MISLGLSPFPGIIVANEGLQESLRNHVKILVVTITGIAQTISIPPVSNQKTSPP